MLRSPQILTCSGSLRPLLLLRESNAVACSEPICATWQDGIAMTDWIYEQTHGSKEGTSLCMEGFSFPTCKPLNSDSFSQSLKAVRILDYFINGTWFPSRRRLWDTRPTSFILTTKTGSYFQRSQIVKAFSLSAYQPGMFDHFHSKSSRVSLCITRDASQAESHVTGTWRDCLSAENENRCRQSLVSNLKFYKENKGQWLSGRKNQAKWASVLVALCSVEEEPAFLFTLRSSKLKGRHKGDVRYAAGENGNVKCWKFLICNHVAVLREERMICQTQMWWPLPWGKPGKS